MSSFPATGESVSSGSRATIRWGRAIPKKDANMFVRLRCALMDVISSLDFKNQPHSRGPYLQATLGDKNHVNKKCLWSLTVAERKEVNLILKIYKLEGKGPKDLSSKIHSFEFRISTEALIKQPLARSATLPPIPLEPEFKTYSIVAEARVFDSDGNPITSTNDWNEDGERISSRPYRYLEVITSYHEYGIRPFLAADIRVDWKIITESNVIDVAQTMVIPLLCLLDICRYLC